MMVSIQWELRPPRPRRLMRRRRFRSSQRHHRARAVIGQRRIHLASAAATPCEEEVEEFLLKAAAKLTSIGIGEAEMQPLLTEMRAHLCAQRDQLPPRGTS